MFYPSLNTYAHKEFETKVVWYVRACTQRFVSVQGL